MLSIYLAMLDDESERNRFESLYRKYKNKMIRIAYCVLKSEDKASDALSNALLAIAKNIDSLPADMDETHEKLYIQKVVRNAAINISKKREISVEFISLANTDNLSSEDTPINTLIENESHNKLVKLIGELPVEYRDVLILRYLCDMSYSAISVAMGIKVNTAKSRVGRAIIMLREQMCKGEENDCG